jgi:hypothetical protein
MMKEKIRSVPWVDLLLILAAGFVAVLIRYQGWRSRELANLDMLPYFQGGRAFLQSGVVQEKGELSSYDSFNPPGTFFLMIPGMLLTSDPRLQEAAGAVLAFFGTLLFLYLLAREIAGRAVAVVVTVVVALSQLGLMGLWPVGHPLFVLGALYFLVLWVKRRKAWPLAVALAVLAFGLYVDLAIIPFVLVIPILWLIYRPPLGAFSLLAAAVFTLAVWFPYLRYESNRGFADLKSLLLLRPVDAAQGSGTKAIYCYSALPGENDEPGDLYLPYVGGPQIEQRVVYSEAGWKNQASYALCRFLLNIDRNFDTDLFLAGASPLLNTILWWIFMAGWVALVRLAVSAWGRADRFFRSLTPKRAWVGTIVAAAGAGLLLLVLNPDLLAHFTADGSMDRNIALSVKQLQAYAPLLWLAFCFGWFVSGSAPKRNPDYAVLAVALSLPLILLMVLGEPGKPERFWFIWPLQALILVLCVRWFSDRLPRSSMAYVAVVLALGVAVLPLPFFSQRVSDALAHGYSGSDNDQWRVIEYLSQQTAPGESKALRVEYWLEDSCLPVDLLHPAYRVSYWFDYLLDVRYGIQNPEANSAAEAGDVAWMVVDKNICAPDSLAGMTPAAEFGHYAVYRIS